MAVLDVKIAPMSKAKMQELTEDILISTYVPDADLMTREDALELAYQRDLDAAMKLAEDAAAVCYPVA